MNTKLITLGILAALVTSNREILEACESTQFLELGERGVIECSFGIHFHAIVWYDSVDTVENDPIANCVKGETLGDDCASGGYDVDVNGSLLISEVSFYHERTFTALKFMKNTEEPITYHIKVVATVKPLTKCPLINLCGGDERACIAEVSHRTEIICYVQNARPRIDPYWVTRSTKSDKSITTQTRVSTNETLTITSSSIVTVSNATSLSLFVCKINVSPKLMDCSESSILLLSATLDYTQLHSQKLIIEHNSAVSLKCQVSNEEKHYLIWRWIHGANMENIGFSIFIGTSFKNVTKHHVDIDETGSLKIQHLAPHHEGQYVCIHSDGFGEDFTSYELYAYVNPSPSYPVVDGCKGDQFCVLHVSHQGRLKCSLKGIWPKVNLRWKTVHEKESSIIHFSKTNQDTTFNGQTFDIVATTDYKIYMEREQRLTLMCDTDRIISGLPDWSTTFELLFTDIPDKYATDTLEHIPTTGQTRRLVNILLPVALTIVAVLVVIVVAAACVKRRCDSHQDVENEQLEAMMPNTRDNETKKEQFLTELRAYYEKQYNAFTPIPFLRDKIYSIHDIFVEGGLQLFKSNQCKGRSCWIELKSYKELIIKTTVIESSVCIAEGDPGQGKSTLALKLVYDWCKKRSPFTNIDVLLFIRLRQLRNINSIFRAIKMILLPRDTALTENDVKNILETSSKVVFILDGYDEFPNRDEQDDVYHIIRRNMLLKSLVLITTRTKVHPKELSPQPTVVRLTGFDEKARIKYINKTMKGDNDMIEIIKHRMEESPILGEFCVVPLFFAMYAHIMHERKDQVNFHSVTAFFRYMISCFHSHLGNKLARNNNSSKSQAFDKHHPQLNNLAYEALSGSNERNIWNKKDISSNLGFEMYEYYKETGILVEEDVTFISDETNILDSPHVQKITEVRFYHKLFCEWYAAHYLSELLTKADNEEVTKILGQLDPFNLQYMYRFACGLNANIATKIIAYLQTLKDGDKFAILCILEQSGNIEQIKESVEELCLETVLLSNESSRLLQRSTLQLIDIASKIGISIKCFHLENCLNSVPPPNNNILLTSELHVGKLTCISCLKVSEMGREFSDDDTKNILEYAVLCQSLKELKFECCMLPETFQEKGIIKTIEEARLEVSWIPLGIWYHLNSSGQWADKRGDVLVHGKYQALVDKFRREWRKTTWQNSKQSC